MVTLGLDASTTTIGWSIYDSDKDNILNAGFFDIKKLNTFKDKAYSFIEYIQEKDITSVENIVLEAALSGFSRGFTSQQTLIKLTRWNAIFEYILSETFEDKTVSLVDVNTLRKSVFGKCRVKGMTAKEFVKLRLNELRNDIDSFNTLNTRGNVDKRNEDMLDAIVCSLYIQDVKIT